MWFGQDAMGRLAGRKVSGTVVDGDGTPAVNLPVKLLTEGMKTSGPVRRGPNDSPTGDANIGIPDASKLQKVPGELAPGEKVAGDTKTDASGRFVFTDVKKGRYQVMAGTGKIAVREAIFVTEDQDPPALKIQLPKAK
jgi:hypothetical protein